MMKKVLHLFFNVDQKKLLLVSLFIALLIRVFYIFQLEEKWYFADTAHYDLAARHLIQGEGFGPSLHYFDDYSHYCLEPVYPIFLSGIYALFGRSFLAVRLFQVALSLLQIYLLFLITRNWFSRKSARLLLVLCLFYPFFIFIAGLLYVTQLFTLLLVLAVWGFVRFQQKSTVRWLVFASAFLTLAALARPIMLTSIPFFLIYVALQRTERRSQRFLNLGVSLAIIAVLLVPWSVRNYNRFGILAPGRACLAEAKVLDMAYARIERKKILQQPRFGHESFSVEIKSQRQQLVLTGYVDDNAMIRLQSEEQGIALPDSFYCGLIFKGGEQSAVKQFVAARKTADSQQAELQLNSQCKPLNLIRTDSVRFRPPAIHCTGKRNEWRYKAVFSTLVKANYFRIVYPDSASPTQMRNAAIWIGLKSPSLNAGGFMVWLHPWLEADLWSVRDGQPWDSVPVEKTFLQREPAKLSKIIKDYPVEFITQHFWTEFMNFWSPYVTRISTSSEKPNKALQLFSFVFFLPVLVFFPVGIWYKRHEWMKVFLLIIPLFCSSVGYSIYFTEIRYRIPVEGFIMIFAVLGMEKIFLKNQ